MGGRGGVRVGLGVHLISTVSYTDWEVKVEMTLIRSPRGAILVYCNFPRLMSADVNVAVIDV